MSHFEITSIVLFLLFCVALVAALFLYKKNLHLENELVESSELAEKVSESKHRILNAYVDTTKLNQRLYDLNLSLSNAGTTIITEEYEKGLEEDATAAISADHLIRPYVHFDELGGTATILALNPKEFQPWLIEMQKINAAFYEQNNKQLVDDASQSSLVS